MWKSPEVAFDELLITNGEEYDVIPYYFRVEYNSDGMIGAGVDLHYSYKLNNYLRIGVRTKTSFLMYYGIENFLVSPFVKFGF